jgi:hypothetical protein
MWSRLSAGSKEPHGSSRNAARRKRKNDLWIAPTTSLSRRAADAAWSVHPATSSDARLLELADIALGSRKPQAFRRRRSQFLSKQSERE